MSISLIILCLEIKTLLIEKVAARSPTVVLLKSNKTKKSLDVETGHRMLLWEHLKSMSLCSL